MLRRLQRNNMVARKSCKTYIIVYHFTKALQEKTDKETGRSISQGSESRDALAMHIEEAMSDLSPALMSCFLDVPFYQVIEFVVI
ncbi:hypothetical protein DVH24_025394 [Malus domestica]|uniref:Uncharacterized protein n=1 Tax=Malus domestica TaxID=3750 RepID=A0A498HSN3_MALDO|nr:hypothetical protein DVH24_025394 [Malus domestica]